MHKKNYLVDCYELIDKFNILSNLFGSGLILN